MRDPGAAPRLVVPEGLVVDENVRERLDRQLRLAPAGVAGIAAEIADLEPGASYRVHTEWSSFTTAALRPASSTSIRGAVLLRPEVDFAVKGGSVEVADGSVMVDPGAQVLDPHRAIGGLQPASARGRPPFSRRPVVVFLACSSPAAVGWAHADWLRRFVNRLVRHEVEARIATPAPVGGGAADVHLTRPCLPCEETIRALAPDVVVTLDAEAAAQVDAWCEGDRSTVVIEFDPTLPEPIELVSWQIGRAAGRLRARVGPWVDVPAFAALVVRLCAGPHPMPPVDREATADAKAIVREHWTGRAPDDAGDRCVLITGSLDAAATARIAGLADNLEAAGVPVEVHPYGAPDALPAAAREAGLVVLAGVVPSPPIKELIAARRGAGLTSAVDLGSHDLGAGGSLTAPAAALCETCDLTISPAGALHSAAGARAARALVLPTLLTRERAAALRDARPEPDPAAVLIIGWRLGAAGPAYAAAVAGGIARILTEHRDRVEIVGDLDAVPAELRGHERVTVVPGPDLDAETIASWAVHVWTPGVLGAEIVDDARLLEEASCAGVPSVLPAGAAAGVDGFVSPHVLVQSADSADDWYDALHHVLDDRGIRARRAHEAARRADALDGPAASKAVVSRLMGIARHRSDRVV
jgi:hypothetical protein